MKEQATRRRDMRRSYRSGRMAFPLVMFNALQDARRQGNGIATILAGDAWLKTVLNTVHEVTQFTRQLIRDRVAVKGVDLQVPAEELVLEHGAGSRVEPAEIEAVLAYIFRRLNEGELAPGKVDSGEAFRGPDLHATMLGITGPAGGDIGHAAIHKRQTRIGHVFACAEDRHAQRLHGSQWRAHESQQDIKIVNHQIQDDTNVGGPAREATEALALNELRLQGVFQKLFQGWV